MVRLTLDKGRNPKTFDWMLSRTKDGTSRNAPRELIHLLNEARNVQLRRLETGSSEPSNGLLFDSASLREALPEVSRVKFHQTLLQEYPDLADKMLKLMGRKAEQTLVTLAAIWEVNPEEAALVAKKLVEIGLFAAPTPSHPSQQTYSIPFLYHPALSIVRGKEQV